MDGGNSFKRRADAGTADKRDYEPEYFLSRAYVDQFEDEVPRRPSKPKRKGKNGVPSVLDRFGGDSGDEGDGNADADEGAGAGAGEGEGEGEDSELNGRSDRTGTEARCASSWKAANGKEQEHTGCEQTGLFGILCRHGLVEWLVEMVRSGELCVPTFLPCLASRAHTYAAPNISSRARTKSWIRTARIKGRAMT